MAANLISEMNLDYDAEQPEAKRAYEELEALCARWRTEGMSQDAIKFALHAALLFPAK